MSEANNLKSTLERLAAGTHFDTDIQVLRQALQAGQITLATGERAVALGGNASDTIIVTGDGNIIFKGADAEAIQKAIRQMLDATAGDRRVQALQDYLAALCNYCNQLTYITLPGKPLPPLSDIYIEQLSEEQHMPEDLRGAQHLEKKRLERHVETVEKALERYCHLVLQGEPGIGKSTSLHHIALTLAKAWLEGKGGSMVPVRVSARGLAERTGSLSESLHEQVTAELGQRLQSALPPDFFAHPPSPDTVWLVLLDGLDEIVAQKAREHLMQAIRHHVANAASCYRFMVTTRPLPEVGLLDRTRFGHYTLRPFEPGQMSTFARNWFAVRPGSRLEDAERFLRRVEESRIGALAQVPLLLTMAAVIYERDRDRPLPTRRAGLYERFVKILLEDEEVERETREPFRRQWDWRYGHEGEVWADCLFSKRCLLLEHLALWQQEGGVGSLMDEAIGYTYEQGWLPQPVDKDWLQGQMETLLRRTGLLIRHGDEEIFTHDTFREYLAAMALARMYGPNDEGARAFVSRWTEEGWREVVLFLLGIWSEAEQDVTELVRRIWKSSKDGLLFTGAALAEGARVAAEVNTGIVNELFVRAKEMGSGPVDFFKRPNLLEVLGTLRGREQVVIGLLSLAHDPEVGAAVRLAAAENLVKLGHTGDAAPILQVLAHDPEGNEWVSLIALQDLERLGRANDLLALVCDPRVNTGIRGLAAQALGKIGRDDDLLVLVRDRGVNQDVRSTAAVALGLLGRGGDLLALARDSGLDAQGHEVAVQALWRLGLVDDLLALAHDVRIDARVRVVTALLLGKLGRVSDVAPTLLTLVRDLRVGKEVRLTAAVALERFGWIDDLLSLARDPRAGKETRLIAAVALERPDRVDDLLSLARDPEVDTLVRCATIKALGEVGNHSVLPELERLAHAGPEKVIRRVAQDAVARIHERI